jgi:hypothetical protein
MDEISKAQDLPQARPAMPYYLAIWRRNWPFHQVLLEISNLARYGDKPR